MQIGFVSTRFSGTDGVSLEANKWADIFEAAGHDCYWFAGQNDRNLDTSMTIPAAHFKHLKIESINNDVFGKVGRSQETTDTIHQLRGLLKSKLHHFISRFHLDLLVVENALSIPMNVPLGLAITEIIAETGIPTIAHHHDFAWERDHYARNGISDYLQMSFPPKLPNIEHVVINTAAREQLAHRHGISSTVIPNVINFASSPRINQTAKSFRAANGLSDTDIIILQPTRIVQRKGIELAIDMVRQLGGEDYKLLVSHEAGDEGFHYAEWLQERAQDQGVDLRFMNRPLHSPWNGHNADKSNFSLWDMYAHSDFVTFPSLNEGFGNAFLEAVYFRKPIFVNRYSTFLRDIEPLGFDLVMIDGFVDSRAVSAVREILASPGRRKEMGLKNHQIASRFFSYDVLRSKLEGVLKSLFGTTTQIGTESDYPDNVVDLPTAEALPKAAAQ